MLIEGLMIVGRRLKGSVEAGFSTALISAALSSLASLLLPLPLTTALAATRLLGEHLGFLDEGELIRTLRLHHGCLIQKEIRTIEGRHATALLSATEAEHLTIERSGSAGAALLIFPLISLLVSAAILSLISASISTTNLSVALCHSTYPRIFLARVPDLQRDPAVRSTRSEHLFVEAALPAHSRHSTAVPAARGDDSIPAVSWYRERHRPVFHYGPSHRSPVSPESLLAPPNSE